MGMIPFVLAASGHGPMIVSRFDRHDAVSGSYGVGQQILDRGEYDRQEIELIQIELDKLRVSRGNDLVMVDCGANIGVMTIEIAKYLRGVGRVVGIEAQERLYYALCGNIALGNFFNASAVWAAASDKIGVLKIPQPNYFKPASLGSLELRRTPSTEYIGQSVSYAAKDLVSVRAVTIDSLGIPKLDFLKIDVEGMEIEALRGAEGLIVNFAPTIWVEHIKCGIEPIKEFLAPLKYEFTVIGMNILAKPL